MNEATTVSPNKRPAMVSGLTPYTGTFGREQLIHLLKRTMFGSTKADIDFFAGKPLTEVLNTLMTVPAAPTALPLRYYAARTGLADDPAPLGASWVDYKEDPNYNSNRVGSFKQWWAGQMVNQTRSINEKMVLFWHNHFATETDVQVPVLNSCL